MDATECEGVEGRGRRMWWSGYTHRPSEETKTLYRGDVYKSIWRITAGRPEGVDKNGYLDEARTACAVEYRAVSAAAYARARR